MPRSCSGALASGRSSFNAARPSNAVAHAIGGLLGHDGRPPADFYAAGREELAVYPTVTLRTGEVVGGERRDARFELELADGSREVTRRVLLATGMDYRFPPLPGIEERFGRSVFHCPFCHGWEVRDRSLGVLDPGASGPQRALLLRMWSQDVTLLTDGPAELDAEDRDRLAAAGVTLDERPVSGLLGPGSTLTAIAFADGGERPCGGLLVPATLHQRSALAEQLGAATSAPGHIAFDAVEVDSMFHTTVPGLCAVGDVCAHMPSVANAVAAGSTAAAMIVGGLMAEAHGLAPAAVPSGAVPARS